MANGHLAKNKDTGGHAIAAGIMAARPRAGASRAARLAAAVVAIGAAALSFRATAVVAEATGAVSLGWGWIVPLVVEAGVLTAAALAWVRSGDGVSAAREVTVMTVLLVLSVIVNVAHAATGTILGRIIAGVPPLVLLAAVEGLLREQRRNASASRAASATPGPETEPPPQSRRGGANGMAVVEAAAAAQPVATPATILPLGALSGEPAPRPISTIGGEGDDAIQTPHRALVVVPSIGASRSDADLARLIRAAVGRGETVTGALVAKWLGCSARTGSRKLKAITDAHPLILERQAQ